MEELIIYLTAIASLAKDLHYNMSGKDFYGNHLLMDRIYDGIYDFIDEIKENYYMYNGLDTPSDAMNIYPEVIKLLEKTDAEPIEAKLKALKDLTKDVVYLCDDFCNEKKYDCGDKDLLGRIAVKMKNGAALLNRTL